jgi:hypothetical protein
MTIIEHNFNNYIDATEHRSLEVNQFQNVRNGASPSRPSRRTLNLGTSPTTNRYSTLDNSDSAKTDNNTDEWRLTTSSSL